MALVLADRVRDTTTTTGTGTITLSGTAPTGYQNFSVVGNGNTTYYTINADSQWEVGIGTYSSTGPTLSRNTVLASSNGGALVDFAVGTKDVFITYPAEKAVTDAYGTALAATTATNIAGGAAGSIPYQTAANTTSLLAAGTGVLIGGSTPSYTMSPSLTQVTVATDPSTALQVATKQYVDTIAASGVTYHTPVKYETPTALTATYNNGSSGVGATLTNAGTLAAFAPDGVVASVNDRILVYNQANPVQNGVYTVTTVGSGSVAWVLTRATDADTYALKSPNGLGEGDAFFVTSGDTGAGETYICNTSGTITFGTTAITFVQVSSAQVYSAGTGLTLTGTVFSLTSPVATTLGGTGLTSFTSGGAVYATSSSALTTGTLPATAGGTGQSSYTTGDLLYATSGTALGGLADVATGNALLSGGVGAAPAWGKVGLTTHVTGTLPVANGGSGATSLTGYLVGNGTSAFTTTATIPTSDLSGTISLTTQVSGTLGAGNGGTGISSYTVGDILYASATTTLSTLADVATGNALISGGVSNPPSWGKIGLTTHVSGTLPVSNGGSGATTLTGYLKGNGTSAFTASATIPAGDITGAALTKADDTNVTLTLGGSPSTALLAATSITAGWTGQLAVSRGGTGNSTLTSNYLLKGNGVSPVAASIIYDDGTNAGIGTSAPGQTLQVVNAGSYQFRLGAGSTFNYDLGRSTSDGLLYFYGNQSTFTGYVFGGVDGERMRINSSGNVTANVDIRAPIFYDSDNTGNYLNPAGTSQLVTVQTSGGSGFRSFATPSASITSQLYFGNDSNTRAWNWQLDENNAAALWNYNGTAWQKRFTFTENASGIAAGDFRAPIFYDSDNTGYYVNPNGTSLLNTVGVDSLLNLSSGAPLFISSASAAYQRVDGRNDGSDSRAHWYGVATSGATSNFRHAWYDGSAYFNVTASSGQIYFERSGGATVNASGDFRAPIFYDSNNTGYYLDPASISRFSSFLLGGNETYFYESATNALTIRTGGSGAYKYFTFDASGNFYALNGSVYGDTFYDQANTAYYANPAGTSLLGGALFNNVTIDPSSIGAGVGVGTITESSTGFSAPGIAFGGGTGQHGAIVYAGSTMYFGSENGSDNTLGVRATLSNSGSFAATGDFRAPIFYDSNNTAYYVDPASGSTLAGQLNQYGYLNIAYGGSAYAGMGISNTYASASNFATSFIDFTNENNRQKASLFGNFGTDGSGYLQFLSTAPGVGRNTDSRTTTAYAYYNQWSFQTAAGIATNIVYDRDNTGYYVDPNSTSNLYGLTVAATISGFVSGCTFSQDSQDRDDITTRVDSGFYQSSTGTTAEGWPINDGGWQHMLSCTHSNDGNYYAMQLGASFFSQGLFYRSTGGSGSTAWSRLAMYGSNYSSSLYANIYYDSNDTGYYVDPNGTSVMTYAQVFNIGVNQAINTTWRIITNGTNGIYLNGGGYGQAEGSWRAPIFYDSDNTGYYTNPAGTSVLFNFQNINQRCAYDRAWDNYPSITVYNTTDQGPQGDFRIHGAPGANGGDFAVRLLVDGNVQSLADVIAGSAVRGPIFYDSDNTGYYLDPASTSNINTLSGNGKTMFETGDSYLRINQSASFVSGCWFGGSNIGVANATLHLGSNGDPGTSRIRIIGGSYNGSTVITLDGTNGNITAAGNVTAYSDGRLKEDVETIDNALDLIGKMRGVTYTRKDTGSKGVGVIAQEMQGVIPQVVEESAEGTLSVAYGNLVGVLIEAVKELTARVAELEGK